MSANGITQFNGPDPDKGPSRIPAALSGLGRLTRAVVRLARAHRHLEHLPTLGQVRLMACLDGTAPHSYLIDPTVSFIHELEFCGYKGETGYYGLAFSCEPQGMAMRFLAMRDGAGCGVWESEEWV